MKRLLVHILFLTLMATTAMAQLPEGWQPCGVSELAGTWSRVDGKNNIVLSFVAPSQMQSYNPETWMYDYQDLGADITKIEVRRSEYDMYDYQLIKTFENPKKGEAITFTDEDVAYGRWDYSVLVYVGETTSDEWDWNCKTTVVAGQIPAEIDDLVTIVYGNKVTFTFTVPTIDTDGNPLDMAVNATLSEMVFSGMMPMPVDVATKENVKPGESVSIVVENAADGSHSYTVSLSTVAGSNDGYFADVFVGSDLPGEPSNANATISGEGVVITWEAPMSGQEGGDFGDPEGLTYNVYRKANVFEDGELIASELKALTFTDVVSPAEETKFFYDIAAVNARGEGMHATTNAVVLGPASKLPYAEGFEAGGGYEFDHSTISKDYSGFYCTWNVANSIFINDDYSNVEPHTGIGLAYAMYNNFLSMSQWDAFTTGNIDFSEANNPVCSFYLFDIANGGSDMKLKVQVSADGTNFTDAKTMTLGQAETSGWTKVEVSLAALKGAAKGQVRICSEVDGQNIYPVVIDDLLIADVDATGINSVGSTASDDAIYNLQGQRVSAAKAGIFIKNGKKVVIK